MGASFRFFLFISFLWHCDTGHKAGLMPSVSALLLQRIPVSSGGLEGEIAADSDSERFSLKDHVL